MGAILGLARAWPDRLVGLVLAFGAGALISAVSFDLAQEGERDARGRQAAGSRSPPLDADRGWMHAGPVVGFALADVTGGNLRAGIDGFAAGALLVMLVDSMIPDATAMAGRAGGLFTVLGFAVAAALSGVG